MITTNEQRQFAEKISKTIDEVYDEDIERLARKTMDSIEQLADLVDNDELKKLSQTVYDKLFDYRNIGRLRHDFEMGNFLKSSKKRQIKSSLTDKFTEEELDSLQEACVEGEDKEYFDFIQNKFELWNIDEFYKNFDKIWDKEAFKEFLNTSGRFTEEDLREFLSYDDEF